LIVEDDEQTQEALRLAFQIFWPEAKVVSAASGQDGISFARREHFDATLLDLKLPDITGHEVLREIRTFSRMPVIIVTATRNQDEVIKCLKAGANEYIFKPFRQLELMSRIREHVNFGAAAVKV
jgi:DNA-binding response OmpR family regulator